MSKWGVSDVRWSDGGTYVKFVVTDGIDIVVADFEVCEGVIRDPDYCSVVVSEPVARAIYKSLVLAAPDGMKLLPEAEAIAGLCRGLNS